MIFVQYNEPMKKILIIGALGQLGSEIATKLREMYGNNNVVLTDIRDDVNRELIESGPFYLCDSRDGEKILEIVKKHKIDTVYELAALLSATAEKVPQKAWDVNMGGLMTTLEIARTEKLAVFTPSSIGCYGPTTPKVYTPQDTLQRPTSMYGVTKVAGELLCDYYHHKYDVDTRGVRYPGIISYMTPCGGGTTDYAVDIFYEAIKKHHYSCFLSSNTYLDMMYMEDAVRASIEIMNSDPSKLRHRNAFNVTAMSFCPEEIAAHIRNYIPEFTISYNVDPIRQAIADSWPNSLEDYAARVEWGWKPKYNLEKMVKDMIEKLKEKGVKYEGN